MKKTIYIMSLIVILFTLSCRQILDTNPTNEDLFTLSVAVNQNKRIIDTLHVKLTWSDITIENFKEIKITRLNRHRDPLSYPSGLTLDGWITLLQTDNPFLTTFMDTVSDDAEFLYRVDYIDNLGNFRRAESMTVIPATTQLNIPSDPISIKDAVESYIIDSGDTVFVAPGEYMTHAFTFGDKEVYLINPSRTELAVLIWVQRIADVEPLPDTAFVMMRSGLIQGFGLIGGWCFDGGGINARGDAVIRQCVIRKNIASSKMLGQSSVPNAGYGGGLYLSGTVRVENCVIDSNLASKDGSGVYIDGFATDVKLVNCIINENDLYSNSPNVTIINTIFKGATPPLAGDYIDRISMTYSHAGQFGADLDSTNIIGDIKFKNLVGGVDYHLLDGSVCIDTGDPGSEFNDIDGTRNDIGAFGGTFGGWSFYFSGVN